MNITELGKNTETRCTCPRILGSGGATEIENAQRYLRVLFVKHNVCMCVIVRVQWYQLHAVCVMSAAMLTQDTLRLLVETSSTEF